MQPQTTLTYTVKLFVITALIVMPHLNNHRVVHCDVNATIVVWSVHIEMQIEVDMVICCRWTREFRGDRIVGAACVSHYFGQLNDVTADRCLVACSISRETNKICRRVR